MASQVLWRTVQAKLSAREGEHERAQAAISGALDLIDRSDWLDWQGKAYLDLAEVCRLGGQVSDALAAVAQAGERFTAKGNVVSARQADELAARLRAGAADAEPGS